MVCAHGHLWVGHEASGRISHRGGADIPVSNSRRHGPLLRTKRHTATGKQIQVLVAAVNRHIPATPSRCCRWRRASTRSIFPSMYRQVGTYAERILRGEKPASFPAGPGHPERKRASWWLVHIRGSSADSCYAALSRAKASAISSSSPVPEGPLGHAPNLR